MKLILKFKKKKLSTASTIHIPRLNGGQKIIQPFHPSLTQAERWRAPFLNKRDIFTSQRAAALAFWEQSSALNPFFDHPCLETPSVTHRALKSPSSHASSQSPSHSHTSKQLFSPPAPKHSIHRFDPAFPLPEEPFPHQEPSQNPSSRINHHLLSSPITLYIEGRKGQMWGPRGN